MADYKKKFYDQLSESKSLHTYVIEEDRDLDQLSKGA